jgi:hypothetical protein
MENVLGMIFSLAVFSVGFILIYGAKGGWKFLIDPPESWWFFYSQSFIKKIFGKKFLYYETIVVGGMFIIASLYPWVSIIFKS